MEVENIFLLEKQWKCFILLLTFVMNMHHCDVVFAGTSSHISANNTSLSEIYATQLPLEKGNRLGCPPFGESPINRVNTTIRLEMLRSLMTSFNVDAYIITSDDQHQSESISPENERRQYITGFTGSSGTAVVTIKHAALWTDGRYYLQADQQLDCQWILMKSEEYQVPTIGQWLKTVLSPGQQVSADPKLVSVNLWLDWQNELEGSEIWLNALPTNLVDVVWRNASGENLKPTSNKLTPAYIHEVAYAGKRWQDKVNEVRAKLLEQEFDSLVVTALDEIAWLLNLRGADLPYSPLVESYVFLSTNKIVLFIESLKLTNSIREHLNSNGCQEKSICVEVRDYVSVYRDLPDLAAKVNSVLLPSKYAYSGGVSYAIYTSIPENKRRTGPSPGIFLKAKKNAIEVEGMQRAHIKDAVALCEFIAILEEQVRNGTGQWDELKVAQAVDDLRQQQDLSRGPSFATIAGFGPNGAVVHYRPSEETNRVIDNSSFLVLDSGGQYLDGTTDITRTFHFGEATQRQKEIYTRVLMGAIDMATLVFPDTIDDTRIDVIARQHLYHIGLDYPHGTGHGIGSFLNVHESPIQIRIKGKESHYFSENYFFSDEPGYYLPDEYGIRLESILRVVHKNVTRSGNRFLGFEPVTMFPFESDLILTNMLTSKQLKWLNDYHQLVFWNVGAELIKQNRNSTKCWSWLVSKTRPFPSS